MGRAALADHLARRAWASGGPGRLAGRLFFLLLLSGLIAGCQGSGRFGLRRVKAVPPRDAREALARINKNLAKISGAIYGHPALVSFRFRDASGRDRRFVGHPATVIFERPRCLYFDIKSPLAGSVAHLGSNNERYWLWIDVPDTRKLWYGDWDALERGTARRLAIPPGQLLDALLLRPLPEALRRSSRALLRSSGDDQRLLFVGLDDYGWPYVKRELVLDPKPPYMPLEIIDRLPDGRIAMHAYLKNYKPIRGTGPDGPSTARRYVVYWEQDRAELRLDLAGVRYRTKQVPFCEFPEGWDGEIEALDQPPAPQPGNLRPESTTQP